MSAIKLKDKAAAEKLRTLLDVAGGISAPRPGVDVGGGIHVPPAVALTTHVMHLYQDGTDWVIPVDGAEALYETTHETAAAAVTTGTASPEQTTLAALPARAEDLPTAVVAAEELEKP